MIANVDAMASKGLRRTTLSSYTEIGAGDELRKPLKPLLAIACVSCWGLFFNCLFINRFKVAECIQVGGKKGKLFCNFRFVGRFCANCKCA
jgi:hypothetical protein